MDGGGDVCRNDNARSDGSGSREAEAAVEVELKLELEHPGPNATNAASAGRSAWSGSCIETTEADRVGAA